MRIIIQAFYGYKLIALVVGLLISAHCSVWAVVALDATTTANFIALNLGGESDPVADNQANRVDIELVGNEDFAAFYLGHNSGNGEMFFRTRVSGENGTPDGIQSGYTYVGLDVTNNGAVDYWIEHGGTPNQSISILDIGATANNSPASLTMGGIATYNSGANQATIAAVYFDPSNPNSNANSYFATVESIDDVSVGGDINPSNFPDYDPYDLDGGGKASDGDRFLTFSLDSSMLFGVIHEDAANGRFSAEGQDFALFDEDFAINWIVVTSQNGNNINSDLGGIDDNNVDANIPFVDQPGVDGPGAGLTPSGVTVTGETVPEPASYPLLFGLGVMALVFFKRK